MCARLCPCATLIPPSPQNRDADPRPIPPSFFIFQSVGKDREKLCAHLLSDSTKFLLLLLVVPTCRNIYLLKAGR